MLGRAGAAAYGILYEMMHKALAADRTRAATRSLFAVHRPGAIDGRAAEAHRLAVALHGQVENHSWRVAACSQEVAASNRRLRRNQKVPPRRAELPA